MAKGVILGQDSSIKSFGENVVEDGWSVKNKNDDGIIITDSLVRTLVGGRGFVVKKDTVEFDGKEARFVGKPSTGESVSSIGPLLGMEDNSRKIIYNGYVNKNNGTIRIDQYLNGYNLFFLPDGGTQYSSTSVRTILSFNSLNLNTKNIYGVKIDDQYYKFEPIHYLRIMGNSDTNETQITPSSSGYLFIW